MQIREIWIGRYKTGLLASSRKGCGVVRTSSPGAKFGEHAFPRLCVAGRAGAGRTANPARTE